MYLFISFLRDSCIALSWRVPHARQVLHHGVTFLNSYFFQRDILFSKMQKIHYSMGYLLEKLYNWISVQWALIINHSLVLFITRFGLKPHKRYSQLHSLKHVPMWSLFLCIEVIYFTSLWLCKYSPRTTFRWTHPAFLT